MAIKDIIGPGFVGTSTIKFIVTRGFSIGEADVTSAPSTANVARLGVASAEVTRLGYTAEVTRLGYAATVEKVR